MKGGGRKGRKGHVEGLNREGRPFWGTARGKEKRCLSEKEGKGTLGALKKKRKPVTAVDHFRVKGENRRGKTRTCPEGLKLTG